ncbi:hypothetical protein ALC56_03861 [Trachymyrmex septentrionalis]|uniref:Uncharacterized protein n=1 Tax=Trachymyrmex septentrionalis TaxID=34720 RepID=A0A195FMM5_9HYME|nr:hypothetical protein ALC56_03861 [Trachymyrmex septentrionalis]
MVTVRSIVVLVASDVILKCDCENFRENIMIIITQLKKRSSYSGDCILYIILHLIVNIQSQLHTLDKYYFANIIIQVSISPSWPTTRKKCVLPLIKEKCNMDEKLDEVTTAPPPPLLEPQGSVVLATTEGGTKEVIAAEFLCRREKEM